MKKMLVLFFGLIVLTGCLTSEDPFYQKEDIKTDERLLGEYKFGDGPVRLDIQNDWNRDKGYLLTVVNEESGCSAKFTGTLFKRGTNRFLDLFPKLEPCDERQRVMPDLVEILKGITMQSVHLVLSVEVQTNAVKYGCVDRDAVARLAIKFPEYFSMKEGRVPRIIDTKKGQEFLTRFGGDTNLFKPFVVKKR